MERPETPPSFDPSRSTVENSETTETKRVWKNADGTQTVEVSTAPARYRDAKGNWVEFDLTLVPLADGRVAPKAAKNGAVLRAKAEGDVASLDTPAGPVRLRHPGSSPAPAALKGNVATYKGALDGRDLTLAVTAAGIEESVVLPSAAASGTYRNQLVLPEGARARESAAGVEILDRQGDAVALFGNGLAYDVKGAVVPVLVSIVEDSGSSLGSATTTTTNTLGAPPASSSTTSTTLAPSPDATSTTTAPTAPTTVPTASPPASGTTAVTVEVAVDAKWLAEPGRAFPVTIDPGLTQTSLATGGNDTFVLSGPTYSGTSFAGAGELWIGANAGQVGRAYLRFPGLPAADPNYYVTQSYLKLNFVSGVNNCLYRTFRTTGVAAQQNQWQPASTTWNNQPPLDTAAPVTVTSMAPGQAGCSGSPASFAQFDTTALAQRWLAGTAQNNGLAVFDGNEGTATVLARYYSSRLGTPPSLYVSYGRKAPTSEPATDAPGAQVTDPAAIPVIRTATPTLLVKQVKDPVHGLGKDADGDVVYYNFRATPTDYGAPMIDKDAEYSAKVVDSGWIVPPCLSEVCSYPVPRGALRDGVAYSWHVWTFDGNTAWVPPTWTYRFRVDLGIDGAFPRDQAGPAEVHLLNGNVSVKLASPTFPTVGGPAGVSLVYNSQASSQGLHARYYLDNGAHNLDSPPGGPVLERTDPNVNFWWWTNPPAPNMPATGWMARWSGYIEVPGPPETNGQIFTFGAYSADGARVVIDNTTVLNSWQDQSAWPNANWGTPIELARGRYPIRVDYYQNDGPAENDQFGFLGLVVKGAVAEQVVPASWLTTEPRHTDPHNNPSFVRPGPISPGWSIAPGTLSYTGARLEQNSLVLTDANGGAHSYRWTGSGYAPVADEDGTVAVDTDGGLSLAADDGRTYSIDRTGRMTSAFTAADESGSASLGYTWQEVDGISRLVQLRDPVGGGTITLDYRSVNANPCPTTAPSGLAPAPLGALCRIRYVDGSTETKLWYNANGQLARIQDPGDPNQTAPAWDKPALTDLAYDDKGRLQTVRTPLANDAIVAGDRTVPTNPTPPDGLSPDTTITYISYDDQNRVVRVSLPKPSGNALEPRPGRRYEYSGAGGTREIRVHVDGAPEPAGHPWARQVVVTSDATARTTTVQEADATGQVTAPASRVRTTVFDAADRPIRATDTAGRQTVSVYDGDATRAHATGRVTDVWGPAPASCFSTYPPPDGACSSQNPAPARSSTTYDADPAASGVPTDDPVRWTGLVATYFTNGTLAAAGLDGGVIKPKTRHGAEAKPLADGNLLGAVPSGLPTDWSARFRGEIELPAGSREFEIVANGRARLWIDDTVVADAWPTPGTPTSARGTFSGSAGRHRIRLDYASSGTPSVLLRWKPGTSFSGVPASVLFPRLGNPTITTSHDSDGVPSRRTYSTYTSHVEGLLSTQTADFGSGRLALATTIRYDKVTTSVLVPTSKALPAATPMDAAKGLPLGVTDPSNTAGVPAADRSTRYEYRSGSHTDPCGSGSADQRGLLWKSTTPDPDGDGPEQARSSERVYDALGRVVAFRASVADVDWVCTTYDVRGRVKRQTFPGGRQVNYAYGVGGSALTTSVADSTGGTILTTIDLLGRTTKYVDRWGDAKKTESFFDQAGLLTRTNGPQGRVDFAYDPAGRVDAVRLADAGAALPGPTVARPVYDGASGELTSVAYCSATTVSAACSGTFAPYGGNGTTLAVERDSAGSVKRVTSTAADGTTMADDVVSRSRSGKVVDQSIDGTDPNAGGTNFGYDAAGRLTTAHVPGHALTYAYAASGGCGTEPAAGKNSNRTSMSDSAGPSATYCYNRRDQLTSVDPSLAIGYNGHGATTILGNQELTWDSADRHTRTVVANGGPTVNYGRDATGRITSRDEGTAASTTQYIFAGPGDSPIAVANSGGGIVQRLVPLPGGVLLTKQASGDVWSYPNVHGDLVVTANASGTKGMTRTYDPFGQGEAPDNSQGEFDYGWLGQHQRPLEHAGSIATIEMGARPYVPALGRFLAVDPLDGGSANEYDYSFGDPTNGTDLMGLCGVFGNPFKRCEDPKDEFDMGTIDRSTGAVVPISAPPEPPKQGVGIFGRIAKRIESLARPILVPDDPIPMVVRVANDVGNCLVNVPIYATAGAAFGGAIGSAVPGIGTTLGTTGGGILGGAFGCGYGIVKAEFTAEQF